ncbi:PLxRFG domain-containing protein [Bradyrhizobium sp. SZCCHNS1012]|uniref:PLxRFG domain-containing protein n=1 Tax=Bradyrhizobium sp. SZCCHNS1012 TaxID=3057297 RepID=UPI00291673D2|nr:PLxRFG domain-containing protein [Bradyrhizobium sp. SZCCHNS1012]
MASSFGLNPLDQAIGDAETAYPLSPGAVNPTAPAPGLAQQGDSTDQQVSALNAKEPDTYRAMTPDEFAAFQKQQEAAKSGFFHNVVSGIKSGVVGNLTLTGNAAQAFGVSLGNAELYNAGVWMQEKGKAGTEGLEPRVGSVADVHSLADFRDYAGYQAGNAVGSSVPSIVAGVAGSIVTENPILGAAGAAAIPSYLQNMGDMYGTLRDSPGIAEQVQKGNLTPQQIANYAMIAGIPLAALDMVGEAESLGLSHLLGGAIDKATLGKLKSSIAGRIAKQAAEGSISEGMTEGLQQAIEEGVSATLGDKDPMSKRVISVLDNAIGGLLGGGAMGGGAGGIRRAASIPQARAVGSLYEQAQNEQGQRPAAPAAAAASPAAPPPAFSPAAPAPQAAAPAPAPAPIGPLGRAMERGNAANIAATAEAMVPVGTRVAVSAAGGPPMNVTVQGYHADGMDVVDDSGEVHTLPMNEPDISVTPIAAAAPAPAAAPVEAPAATPAPAIVAQPAPESLANSAQDLGEGVGNIGGGIAEGLHARMWDKIQKGETTDLGRPDAMLQAAKMIRDAGGLKDRAAYDAFAADYGKIERGPTFQADMRALVQKYSPAASPAPKPAAKAKKPEPAPAPVDTAEAKPIPFSYDVAGKNVAFPSDGLAALYGLGKARDSLRQSGRNTSDADKLIPAERQRVADLLGIPLEDVNLASDEYRHMVEQAAKSGNDGSRIAPEFDPKTLTAARDAWNGMSLDERKGLLESAGVKRSPKMDWDALGAPIQNKLKPVMSETRTVDAGAHEAASSPQNDKPEPTKAQVEAGNAELGHERINGMDFSFENPAGSVREDKNNTPPKWRTKMQWHYGYGRGTIGFDKDHLDVFVKPGTPVDLADSAPVYVVDQNKGNGQFDEHKAMIGASSEQEARDAYLAHYEKGWEKNIRGITEMPYGEFKQWARSEGPSKGPLVREEAKPAPEKPGAAPAVDKGAKWFSTRERAQNYVDKKKLGATHEIVQTQKQRFEIRPKAAEAVEEAAAPADDAAIAQESPVSEPAKGPASDTAEAPENAPAEAAAAEEGPAKGQANGAATAAPAKPAYGASNKLVTAARADEIRAKLRAKIKGQLNSGIDPEVLALGAELAAFHIEAGSRKFAAFARAVAKDLGVNVSDVRKYLRAWYNGARDMMEDAGFDVAGMDSPETVRAQAPVIGDQEIENESGVEGGDREGVRQPESERRADPQQGSASDNLGDVEAAQSEDVGEPANDGSGLRGQAGVRASGEDVAPVEGAPGGGDALHRRAGAGGAGKSNARAGKRSGGSGEGSAGEVRSPERVHPAAEKRPESVSPADTGPGDFHITDPKAIAGGGPVARFDKNKAAIELRNQLLDTGVKPTREQQAILAGYTGWGSFGQELFQGSWDHPKPKEGWEARDKWLRENLGKDEWEGLQRSIINAHYTDPPTVGAMWDMMKRAGFGGGRLLEPSIGIGNFFGLMPPDLASRSKRSGIELDPVTGSMAQMLYPEANIQIKGYEESKTPDNFYDLVIGNWPFANIKVPDRRYNRLSPSLHDYFFLKALDQTRPGGLVAGITSSSTMDKKDSSIRAEMARKGELVAAFRLPSGAFEDYAGTKVVTDIIILRKRVEPAGMVANEGWIRSVDMDTKAGQKVSVNEYYHAHPENVIGTIDYGHGTTTFRPGMIVHRPADMEQQLRRIVEMVPEGAYHSDSRGKQISYIANNIGDRTGALVKAPGGFHIVQGEHLALANDVQKWETQNKKQNAVRQAQLSSLIDMRTLYGGLLDAQREGDAVAERKALNAAYKAFVKEHGPLTESYGLGYLEKIKDPFFASLASLESKATDKKGNVSYKPAAILTENTMRGAKSIENPSVSDAFVLARNESVDPSPARIAELAGKPEAEVRRELIDKGAAFEGPSGEFVPADIYLSGNVREKMRQAQAALEQGNKAMERNIEALQKVMPADVPYFKIETQLGATWVPPARYAEYIAHMLGLPTSDKIEVKFQNGSWHVDFPSDFNRRPEAQSGFGMADGGGRRAVTFKRLVRAALSNQTLTVKGVDSDGNEYVDGEKTKEANEKIATMRMRFGEWLWQDPTRRVEMEREYNEVRNAYANPAYDGSFLGFPGMALSLGRGPFDLRQHQVNAIWRALVTRKSLNAHEVGTGKTFTMGGIAVESRRYGIARKPMILAHNANSKSVAAEIQMMYPAAKVLYVDNLSPENIQTRMMQIANDDWDAVVIPHSLIDRIGFKEETLRAMAQEELDALEREAMEAAQEEGVEIKPEMWEDEEQLKKLRAPTAKDLVKQRLRIINQIKKLSQRASRDDSIAFENLGVDQLLVDEAHEFKKPPIATKMRMKGLQTQTSDRSISLMFLTKYVRAMNNGANVHLFTGTPITNTLTEVFHQMRYIMNEEMAQTGLSDWDGWFGSFAREVNDVELSSTGEYEPVTRLQAFINVPELRRMVGQYMDVVFSDDMPEMQPRTVNGKTMADKSLTEAERAELLNGRTEHAQDRPYKKVENSSADMSPEQNNVFEVVQGLARQWRQMSKKDRREAMRRGDPTVPIIYDNMAEKASFDVRLVNAIDNAGKEGTPEMEPHPDSKPARAVRNLVEIYNSHPLANQVVFMEQGMHKSVSRSEGEPGNKTQKTYKAFSTMYDMIERLVQAGIPREEIAVVTGATSKDKRKEIADKMNTGELRIVFGSTDSLGVGVNMQRNLRAMHHLDAPWMPGDLEQRNGRGQRQGNQWNTVLEHRYLTDKLDGRRWQVLAIKQKFINEFLKSDDSVRVIEGDAASDEQSDILSTFSEAAGDPRVLIREKLKKKVEQLQSRERTYLHGKADAKRAAERIRKTLPEHEQRLAAFRESGVAKQAADLMDAQRGDGFKMTLGNKAFNTRKDASDAARDLFMGGEIAIGEDKQIGTYGGIPLYGAWGRFASKPDLYVKIGNEVARSEGPSLPSLEAAIRSLREQREKKLAANVADAQRTLAHNEAVAEEPFHFAGKLSDTKAQLADLEQDISANPVAPPYWLRAGAPAETEVYAGDKPFVVTGHRWTNDGYFVLAQDENGKATAIPYMKAQDKQGMPLYQEHRFTPPQTEPEKAAGVRESVPANDGMSITDEKLKHWQRHVERILARTATADYDVLAKPSPVLAASGIKGRIVLTASDAKAISNKHRDLPRAVWDNLPNLLSDPLFIYPHPTGNKNAVLVARTAKNEPIIVGIKVGDRNSEITTITPNNNDEGRTGWQRVSTRLRNLLGRGENIYARSRDALDRTLMLTGADSRAIRPYGAELPGQGRVGNVTTRAALVKSSETRQLVNDQGRAGMSPEEVRAVLDGTALAGPLGKLIDAGNIVIEPEADSDANAYVTDADGVIHLVSANLTPGQVTAALLHEAFHSGVRPLIGDKTWSDLLERLNELYNQARRSTGGARGIYDKALERMAHAQETSGPYSAELTPEEFGAYVISELETMPRAFGDWAREVLGAVKAWMLRRFGRQLGAVTPDQLRSLALAAIRDGVAGTEGRTKGRRESVAAPRASDERVMPRTAAELSEVVKGLAEDARGPALSLLPLNVLTDWAAPNQTAAREYIDTKRRMDTYRNKKQNAADAIVQRWRKAVGKGGKVAKDLAGIMHDATLLGFDPARPSDGWQANPTYERLMRRYQALSPNARAIYAEVRDAYVREADERDKVILENVSKAMDAELRNAERARERELSDIRDEGLEGDAKKAVEAAEHKFKKAQQKLKFSKKARLAALRAAFESNRVPAPYFPLARFGRYFVTARNDVGKVLSFSRAESKGELDRITRDLRKQFPHANIETGLLEDRGSLRSQMDPRVLADIQAILGNAGVSEDVMDQVWQRYLEAMPDLSIRKSAIHRGGVAGFNTDAMRAFASHMFHSAHQMGRMKFGGDMLELVNQAVDQAKKADNPISAMNVANELRKRHDWVMNPQSGSWAQTATTLGFLYFLGASPASAAVNLSQTAIMGVPILGSRFGMGKATAALGRALRDFTSGKGSVETSKNLTADEKRAIADLYERGALDKSMSHDLAGVADRGTSYNPTRQRVMQVMSYLFHHAERLNREVTALAAYRLARQAGTSHEAAVDKAGELTWLTHFDYSNTNRPRIMQNDTAKVVLLFKNFQINMLYRLFRDTQQAFAGDTPQARKQARYQLAGIMGMHALMAGGLGVPLMKQIIIPLWKMIFGNEPDKSADEEFRDAVLNTLGPQLGGIALDGVPGYLTGTSLTKRMGMADLWFNSDDREQDAKDWWNSLANDMLGPVWGMAHNVYNGYDVIRDGKGVARGIEMMMPTEAKNLMKAWRYAQEGVVNMRGDQVVAPENIGLGDALKQALGFTPAEITEQYTRNNEKYNIDKRITNERKELLDGYARAQKSGDKAAIASALEDIREFNAVPTHAAKQIKAETLRESIRSRNRLSSRAENGLIISNKRENARLNEQMPPRVY